MFVWNNARPFIEFEFEFIDIFHVFFSLLLRLLLFCSFVRSNPVSFTSKCVSMESKHTHTHTDLRTSYSEPARQLAHRHISRVSFIIIIYCALFCCGQVSKPFGFLSSLFVFLSAISRLSRVRHDKLWRLYLTRNIWSIVNPYRRRVWHIYEIFLKFHYVSGVEGVRSPVKYSFLILAESIFLFSLTSIEHNSKVCHSA